MIWFRRRIYVGEADGCAVYLDLKTNQALVADKSALLNTEGAKKTNRAIVPLIVLIEILPIIFGYYNITFQNKGYYSPELIPIFGFAYIFVALGFIWMMERALYKNVKRAIPTDKKTYVKAMISNQLWDPAAKKQVSFWKYILFIVILLSVLGVTFVAFYAAIPSIFHSFEMREPFDIQIYGSLLAGLLPGVSYTLIFQNNPFLWFHAINMYDKRKVIFKEDQMSESGNASITNNSNGVKNVTE